MSSEVGKGNVIRVSVDQIEEIEDNVREMSEEEFNALVKSIEDNGYVEFVQVVEKCGGGFKIVNGQHRFRALRDVFGMTEIDVLVVGRLCCEGDDSDNGDCWDNAKYWTEVLRLNAIRGEWIKPELAKKVVWLYNYWKSRGLTDVEIKEKLGFVGKSSLVDKILRTVEKSVPDDVKKEIRKKKKEAETLEDVINVVKEAVSRARKEKLFDVGYIVFSAGGRKHAYVEANIDLFMTIEELAIEARNKGVKLYEILCEKLGC